MVVNTYLQGLKCSAPTAESSRYSRLHSNPNKWGDRADESDYDLVCALHVRGRRYVDSSRYHDCSFPPQSTPNLRSISVHVSLYKMDEKFIARNLKVLFYPTYVHFRKQAVEFEWSKLCDDSFESDHEKAFIQRTING